MGGMLEATFSFLKLCIRDLLVIREISGLILHRDDKLCNLLEWRGLKVVYRRYEGLFFCMCIDPDDNELETLEVIHQYVEILDLCFGNVCEVDIIYNFYEAYYILDELVIAGEVQESNRMTNLWRVLAQAAKEEASSISNIISQATK
ncbi:AP-1 complex subunit sigma-1-like [Syzygium oleosum]|uniref:AP-1 complex subunit sigma-1-like n=1 Tax=Syzygium oleosum TaxID=219896 RepID=UPI0024BB4527|nr:AP-1 complex subunit sigma-1-like [Syzygium oleosum]